MLIELTPLTIPVVGRLATIDIVLLGWFALVVASVAYVAYDASVNSPELTVMKWGWLLVALYTGPIGLGLYILSCKEPRPYTHKELIKPLWQEAMGSRSRQHPLTGSIADRRRC